MLNSYADHLCKGYFYIEFSELRNKNLQGSYLSAKIQTDTIYIYEEEKKEKYIERKFSLHKYSFNFDEY